MRKVRVTASDCWEWTGRKDKDGYGRIEFENRDRPASRVMWIVTNGPIPPGKQVCHTCDNPPCINPDHLFLGTNLDNVIDSIKKGRKIGFNIGETNNMTSLTGELVSQIRAEYAKGTAQVEIGKLFAIPKVTVHNIVKRKTWKHVA
jgi:hypothetical protein